MKIVDLAARVLQGESVALAKALTMVENQHPGAAELLRTLAASPAGSGSAFKIGITGSPGSGKSTLIERLIDHFKSDDRPIGVLAVDPSSPLSGGAILGDRIRMLHHGNDERIFIRSLASRGALGGLSRHTFAMIELLAAAGKRVIIVETVGVGQSEVDIANLVDVVVMVLTPVSGDDIQIIKAGIIEIADIFVVNKADLGGADNKVCEIQNYFSMADRPAVVVETVATADRGIDELIQRLREFEIHPPPARAAEKNALRRAFVLKLVGDMAKADALHNPETAALLEGPARWNPYQVADEIYRKIKSGGRHGH